MTRPQLQRPWYQAAEAEAPVTFDAAPMMR
jgi:hypothetical protein